MIYRWKCKVCGYEIEVERSLEHIDMAPRGIEESGDHLFFCSDPVWERVISCGAFCLEGEGWARDGYSKGESDE